MTMSRKLMGKVLETRRVTICELSHIPPNLVVGRCRRTLIASRREDLQVEHPVRCRDASTFDFYPTQPCVLGAPLIRNQVVQMRQACEKRRLAPARVMEALHGKQFPLDG